MKDLSHLSVENAEYVERMFALYQSSPDQVTGDWKYFFDGFEFSKRFQKGTSDLQKELKAIRLIEAYRDFGHQYAQLDPLGLERRRKENLDPARFGISEKDLSEVFESAQIVLGRPAKLSDLIAALESIYCGTLAVQFEDVSPEVRDWILQEFEGKKKSEISKAEKLQVFDQLVKAEGMEKFLHTRYVGVKRFSVEGSENILPVLNKLVHESTKQGLSDVVLGMAHRGRLNVLVNFMELPVRDLFAEFDGKEFEGPAWFTSDVKYHKGWSTDRSFGGKNVHLSLAFNPSHLETVNAVVEGQAWAKQRQKGAAGRLQVLPILIHGDAAAIGQGIVAEVLQMSQLEAYNVGGTVHVIIDNQVGFTTSPKSARTAQYSSDLMKSIQAPVFHVNGDDAEACQRAAELAAAYRMKFKRDVCIRLLSYRKHGHNEGDEPMFTQPVMYDKIKSHPTPREKYQAQLEKEGVLRQGEGTKIFEDEIARLQKVLEEVRANPPKLQLKRGQGAWANLRAVNLEEITETGKTAVASGELGKIAKQVLSVPQQVDILPKLKSVVEKRYQMLTDKKLLDWSGAELLAYGTLLAQGHNVRLVGQDAQRGTFSHRHSVYHDHKTGKTFNPLNSVNPEKAQMYVYDSLLSEYAAMGFEYGVSSADPQSLVIWEAQFGDFANGAQIIIDQYLSAGEQKWQQMSGLVLLLPHGFEGQGPEHSSARLERFLQLCAQGNMQVCYVTTPAQLFHMMRRQIVRDFRKPLVVMSPKSLLRHPKVISSLEELTTGHFQEAIGDASIADPKQVKRAIICTGKIYYELLDRREELKMNGQVALLRAEQIYPFPSKIIMSELAKYSNLKDVIWCQEEPENMGALFFVRQKMNKMKQEMGRKDIGLGYIARPERSSPACGSTYQHKSEQEEILKRAFHL